eukprot:GGOE01064971.1.p1 GENE.GGOE01064971.1~~GGOE01064971.1.p1  ORF type:complete len:184 (+),score=17.95 GGOE01064971.1:51-554(+)
MSEKALNDDEVLLWAPGSKDDDMWDDTELIKAYDAAMAQYFKAVGCNKNTGHKKRAFSQRKRNQVANTVAKRARSGKAQSLEGHFPDTQEVGDFACRPSSVATTSTSGAPVLASAPDSVPLDGVTPPTPPLPPALLTSNPALCNVMLSWYHSGFWTGYIMAEAEDDA